MHYVVKAYREGAGVTLLKLAASNAEEARQLAQTQGYHVLGAQREAALRFSLPRFGKRFSLQLFNQELLALLEAGLSLVEALEILARKARGTDIGRVPALLLEALREGKPFSAALKRAAGCFPPLYVAGIRSSERTGNLREALGRYLDYQQQVNQVRDKVVSASVYPLLLLSVGVLVILFLLGYVVPRFSRVYEDLGENLPLASRWMTAWGRLIGDHAALMGLAFAGFLAAVAYLLTRLQTRARIEYWLWSWPAVGSYLRLYQLACLTRTLAMLLKGGIPFVAALERVHDLLTQPALRHGLEQAGAEIRAGQSISAAFSAHGLATDVGARLLAVGERSGEMGQMMDRIARLYEDELTRWVDWFLRLFEPALMIFIGLAIGAVVLLMYMPIFDLASSIQ